MKKATQEVLGLFARTLPFIIGRIVLLAACSIAFLVLMTLLLTRHMRAWHRLKPSFACFLALFALIAVIAVRFLLTQLLNRQQEAYLAYLARLIRRPGKPAPGLSPVRAGYALVAQKRAGPPAVSSEQWANYRKTATILAIPPAEMNAGFGHRVGRPFIAHAILGYCLQHDDRDMAVAIKSIANRWQQVAKGMLPAARTAGRCSLIGYGGCFALVFLPVAPLFLHFSAPIAIALILSLFQAALLNMAIVDPLIQCGISLALARTIA